MKSILISGWMVLLSMLVINVQGGDSVDQKLLVQANTTFALQLYDQVRTTSGNLIFSPYSISSALAMVYAGARGETARQMAHTLHFDNGATNVHAAFKELNDSLTKSNGGNELDIANSLWPQQSYPFLKSYTELLKNNYDTTLKAVDYQRDASGAAQMINHWVDDKTRHKISQIIEPGMLSPATRMVLVNAIYFYGKWQSPFSETQTHPDTFHVSSDKTTTASFMTKRGDFEYGETDQLQLLSLSYAGGHFELTILLPRAVDGIGDLETNLTTANLATWTSSLQDEQVSVMLPKFKMSTSFDDLGKTLATMGIKDAFTPAADFSGMNGQPHSLYLSDVVHKAYIDVNEKGTEASAVTAVAVAAMAMPVPRKPHVFRADHPFIFFLTDSQTGAILFAGRIMNPPSD